MAMSVILTRIARIVLPGRISRDQPIPQGFCISADVRLILDDHYSGGGVLSKDSHDADLQSRACQRLPDQVRDVLDLGIALHIESKRDTSYRHDTAPGVRPPRIPLSQRPEAARRATSNRQEKDPAATPPKRRYTTLANTTPRA